MITRRNFLQSAVVAGVGASLCHGAPAQPKAKNDRLRFGVVGLRYQGSVIARIAKDYGEIVALCDVDGEVLDKARAEFGEGARGYDDYRKLLDSKDVDVVLIGTPDHWHAPIVIDACRAFKDVYCEKPLTLTVREGQQITKVVKETERVVQVGSWQRSDWRFRQAAEMARAGRLGKIHKITVVLGKNEQGGPFTPSEPPRRFDWNAWQGQTPDTPYIAERAHYTFRWWSEYSGGQMTDWGAHHLDIAQWALGRQDSGPVEVEGRAQYPDIPNGYNVATDFEARYVYEGGEIVEVFDSGRNGLLIEGDAGRLFVNRGALEGAPVEELAERPLPDEELQLYDFDNRGRPKRAGKLDAILNHMGNFYDCVLARKTPISSVESQHRSATVCHLGNLSMKLGRKLKWDPHAERFVGDKEADSHLERSQREGFEIEA